MRYLCLHFPDLPLEAWGDASHSEQAIALQRTDGHRPTLLQCNAKARQLGIRPGMSLASACSLCPTLSIRPQDPAREQRVLQRLQAWASQFSAHIAIQPPHCIVLEIGSSLQLFGGAQALRQQLDQELAALHYRCHYALGASPAAARILALSGSSHWLTERDAQLQALRALPVSALVDHPEAAAGLQATGIHTLAQLLEQPLASIGRRWGQAFLDELSSILSQRAGQLPRYQPAEAFCSEVEFGCEISSTPMLLLALRRLLTEFSGWLRHRQCMAQHARLVLCHHLQAPHRLDLHVSHPQQSANHFFSVARLLLEKQRLAAPVLAIRLEADQFISSQHDAGDLFRRQQHARHALLDRLQARLGQDAVQGITCVGDHRPEFAWRYCEPGRSQAGAMQGLRPVWLRHRPQLLECRDKQPWQQGPIRILRGPERLEAGWWSPRAISRDYYVGQRQDGCRLWLYRERGDGRWYCHGYFG